MKVRGIYFVALLLTISLSSGFACQKGEDVASQPAQEEAKPKITQEELSASVPALNDLHEIVYPLWHNAFPEKDYALIKELLPQADTLTSKLDEAELPGILRDKQEVWNKGKENLKKALQDLHQAVETDNEEEMLKQTEVFHAAFERLMRTIRPVVPELDAFHKEMYKLYHYYMPDYDLEKIRVVVMAMQERLPALKQAELPKRITDRQANFNAAVQELESAVNELVEIVKTDDRDTIQTSVEKVHTAYQKAEHIFD